MSNEMKVRELIINYEKMSDDDYISLTDIAKYKDNEPGNVIENWMCNRTTVEYLGIWESLYNPNFNLLEFKGFKKEADLSAFHLSPTKWIDKTNAIGLVTKSGKYGGETFAHKDIAFKFSSWISVEFELYLIKEFQRLKTDEDNQLDWTANCELAKINYKVDADAIKKHIVPTLTPLQFSHVYANKADLLNVAMFGTTASQWKTNNPNKIGNIRDFASVEQLLILSIMESYNSVLIGQRMLQNERLQLLNSMAITQLKALHNYSKNLFQKKK